MASYFNYYNQKIYPLLFSGCIAIFLATLPFSTEYNGLSIILLIFFWLLSGKYITHWKNYFNNPFFLIFISFYILHILGLYHTENQAEGAFDLERKLALFIFPLVFASSSSELSKKNLYLAILVFNITCFIASLICLFNGIYIYSQTNDTTYLFYHELGEIIDLHATYFSLYISFCTFGLLYFFDKEEQKTSGFLKLFIIAVILYFSLFLVLLGAKMVFASHFLLLAFFSFWIAYKYKKITIVVIIFSTLLLVGSLITYRSDFLRKRITTLFEKGLVFDAEKNNANELTLRQAKWKCALEIFNKNPLIGVGTGDVQDNLQICYTKDNFWGQVFKYNTHNQYLETAVALGAIGLLSLLISLSAPLFLAVKQKDLLLITFLSLFILCFLTESILNRQKGIVFFAFFHSFLSFYLYFPKEK